MAQYRVRVIHGVTEGEPNRLDVLESDDGEGWESISLAVGNESETILDGRSCSFYVLQRHTPDGPQQFQQPPFGPGPGA